MGGGAKVPGPSAEERALQKNQAELLALQRQIIEQQQAQQKVLLPFFAEQEGFDVTLDENGNIASISRTPTETEQLRETLDKELAQRSLAALRGELPVDPGLERNLARQEETLRERLSKQFGPGYETSSAGIETLGDFEANREGLRSAARRGELTLAEQLGIAREQQNDFSRMTSQDFLRQIGSGDPLTRAGAFGQVAQGYGAAQNPYVQQRQMQFQANQSRQNGIFSLIGAGIGAAGSLLGTPAAGAAIFSDEKLKFGARKIGTHQRLGIPIYVYEIDGQMRIGVFAGDVEQVRPEAVGRRAGYRTVDYGAL